MLLVVMHSRRRSLRAVALCLGVLTALVPVGCSHPLQRYEGEDEAMAARVVQQLRTGELDAIKSEMSPTLIDTALPKTLGELQSLFPETAPTSQTQAGYAALDADNHVRSTVITEYGFEDGTYVLTKVSWQRENGRMLLIGLYAEAMPESLERQNRLTFAGKPFWNDLMLLVMGACLSTSIYALVRCLRSRLRTRSKWLWAMLCLIGTGQLLFDWTSSLFRWRILWIDIPVVSVGQAGLGPWQLVASLPLGALVFLARERAKEEPEEEVLPEDVARA